MSSSDEDEGYMLTPEDGQSKKSRRDSRGRKGDDPASKRQRTNEQVGGSAASSSKPNPNGGGGGRGRVYNTAANGLERNDSRGPVSAGGSADTRGREGRINTVELDRGKSVTSTWGFGEQSMPSKPSWLAEDEEEEKLKNQQKPSWMDDGMYDAKKGATGVSARSDGGANGRHPGANAVDLKSLEADATKNADIFNSYKYLPVTSLGCGGVLPTKNLAKDSTWKQQRQARMEAAAIMEEETKNDKSSKKKKRGKLVSTGNCLRDAPFEVFGGFLGRSRSSVGIGHVHDVAAKRNNVHAFTNGMNIAAMASPSEYGGMASPQSPEEIDAAGGVRTLANHPLKGANPKDLVNVSDGFAALDDLRALKESFSSDDRRDNLDQSARLQQEAELAKKIFNDLVCARKMPLWEKRYETLKCVGKGAYGQVYKARDRLTGELVAAKFTTKLTDESYLIFFGLFSCCLGGGSYGKHLELEMHRGEISEIHLNGNLYLIATPDPFTKKYSRGFGGVPLAFIREILLMRRLSSHRSIVQMLEIAVFFLLP